MWGWRSRWPSLQLVREAPMPSHFEERLGALIQEHPEIADDVIAAAQSLLAKRGLAARQPADIARGYLPTICLVWTTDQGTSVEVEVTSTDYECWGPGPSVDVKHFPH